ncbi:MAG TPA: hypothetical protein VES59_08300 [Bacteroidota bacterium]|nr:hypothetical protein [Bacteroidota bacterium]
MRDEINRTPEEVTIDKMLLLSLFSLTSQGSTLESMLKVQKLSFLVAMPLFLARKKAFSLEFYRHQKGPMSTGIYTAVDDFHKIGLMKRDKHFLSNTNKRAQDLVKSFIEEVMQGIPENRFLSECLINVVREFANLRASRLTSLVYDMKFPTIEAPNRELTVRETPIHRHFTKVLDQPESELTISIPDDWMDTLAIALSPSNRADFEKASKSRLVYARS